jgi:hypothetical protein
MMVIDEIKIAFSIQPHPNSFSDYWKTRHPLSIWRGDEDSSTLKNINGVRLNMRQFQIYVMREK